MAAQEKVLLSVDLSYMCEVGYECGSVRKLLHCVISSAETVIVREHTIWI